ncbi:MAG: hypothetical protein L3K15_02170 [Thermoplasmata archaeon]|nr:hypothetical protein [Thermoplasmata archaeon]
MVDISAAEPRDPAVGDLQSLRRFAWIALFLLVVQNATGLFLNLYVALPIPGSFGAVFVLAPILTVHIVTAFLLVIGGVALARFGFRTRLPRLKWISIAALISVVFAVQEGFAFTFTQNNAFSFGMEMGFLGAMVLCGTLLYVTGPAPTAPRPA